MLTFTAKEENERLIVQFNQCPTAYYRQRFHDLGYWYNKESDHWSGRKNREKMLALCEAASYASLEADMQKRGTLCENCYHADKGNISDCPWAREFKAVDGWTAIATQKKAIYRPKREKQYTKIIDSYHVINCPLFVRG